MAYLNLPPKKQRTYQRRGADAAVHSLYNSPIWRKLRASYLMAHPLCECCAQRGVTTPAAEVHHITPISTAGEDLQAMQTLAYDYDNLRALCVKCHHDEHNRLRQN